MTGGVAVPARSTARDSGASFFRDRCLQSVPDGVMTWPMQHPELHTIVSVDGVPTMINETITAVGWISYVKPLIYFGLFGALGGFACWVALI
jgi:hypothetical protein